MRARQAASFAAAMVALSSIAPKAPGETR